MSTAEEYGVTPATAEPATPPRKSVLRRLLGEEAVQGSLTVVGFLLLFAAYGVWLGSTFLNVDARLLDIHVNVPILLLGLAVLVTLVAGLFDLSIAGMATLTTFLTIGLTSREGWAFGIVLVVCLGIGVIGGLINGILVERLRVNTFIATLGTGGVFAGLSAVYSDGTNVVPLEGQPQLPQWFSDLGAFGQKFPSWIMWIVVALGVYAAFVALRRVRPAGWHERRWAATAAAIVAAVMVVLFVLGLDRWVQQASWLVAVLLVAAFVLWVLVQYTTYGRYLRASGANRQAAELAGVKVQREVIKAFMIGGFLAALAGVVLAATQGSAAPDVAASFLLPAFAAAFLSTVVFSTGHFTIWGTIIGGIFVIWVSQGLIVGGLPSTWVGVVNGTVLVSAVALSTIMRRYR